MTTTQPPKERERESQPGVRADQRRERVRLLFAVSIGAIFAAFALLNVDKVKVHWIVTSGKTPLIIVIAVAFALGMVADRILLMRARRRRRATSSKSAPAPKA